ncbi:hypothetical protein DL764_001060 [Monosporascus ibericus]|uniref:C2H2-type domain-containing protein n=1 Tax=Monosporascus ibericus TaxID=155417 RepID=A0A4Q4TR30_9PEZI|nr:hypothetical protein DL764_001060 [Monosporascus ibericus]
MPSKVTRDITGSPRSRQNNDPLADLGKVNEYLIHRKRITIDRLMALLDKWLDINPAFARHAQEGPTSSSREHIYRCHFQRYKCVRCYEAFKCTEELEEHQRADVPCYKSNAKNNADITEAQNQLLRKKPSPGKASTKQWTEIYQIIFPKAKEIPSPYYEYEEGRSSQEWDATQAYREVLRDEVTQRVRERLEARFDQIEDSLKADFLDIVRNAFRDTLKEHPDPHRSSHRGSAETQEVGPPTSGASQAITVAGTGASPSEDMLSYLDLDFQLLPATYIGDASLLPYAEQLSPDCELGPYIFPTDNPVDSGTGLWRAQRGVPGAARSRCRGL